MFFKTSPVAASVGEHLVRLALQRYESIGLTAEHLSLTLLLHPADAAGHIVPLAWQGWSYRGDAPFYPCSVVKVFIMAAVEAALAHGAIDDTPELQRSMDDMIRWSSNTATNYLIDVLTGTTGDTELPEHEMNAWAEARNGINAWLATLNLPEFAGINIAQKLMDDDRYGREAVFVKWRGENHHNRLTTHAAASMLARIMDGAMVSADASARMATRLVRPRDAAFAALPGAQVNGYLAQGLPDDASTWSKAGWTGWTRDPLASYRHHDAIHVVMPEGLRYTLVVFTEGEAVSADDTILPALSVAALDLLQQACPRGVQG